MTKPKRPKDTNSRAVFIAQLATGERTEPNPHEGKNPKNVAKGRKGGLKGGKSRAEKLSPERRKEIAEKAAKKRWGK